MNALIEQLEISREEEEALVDTLQVWSSINSHSTNLAGLEKMLLTLDAAFSPLKAKSVRIKLPERNSFDNKGNKISRYSGDALQIKIRPEAPFQFLLAGHMDTVFEPQSPFQKAKLIADNRLHGPGVADMKGGILIMLTALKLFERLPFAKNIGWQVLLTPDEEIGSPSSEALYRQAAKETNIGLIFEPAFPDGNLVSARKGSANFLVVARGRAAHAGRDFHAGRSAIVALAHYIVLVHDLNSRYPSATLNIGKIEGGEAANIVPELASCHINIRANSSLELNQISEELQQITIKAIFAFTSTEDGITLTAYPHSRRDPKQFDQKTLLLFENVKQCGEVLKLDILWKESGGVSDGNILSAEGLPTVDTLGAVGGNLHTPNEYIEIKSLKERAQLTALLLSKYASHKDI
ncbi:MAG: hydrolase [Parachlamydiaceae bacterium]|nr:hydrolase [Parachlamydiaceae bacterium]